MNISTRKKWCFHVFIVRLKKPCCPTFGPVYLKLDLVGHIVNLLYKTNKQGLESYKTGATRVGKLQNRSDKGWKVAKQERQGLESDCEKWVCTVVTSSLLFHQM